MSDSYNGHCKKCSQTFSECTCFKSEWFIENDSGEWFAKHESEKLFTKNPLEAKSFCSENEANNFLDKNNIKGLIVFTIIIVCLSITTCCFDVKNPTSSSPLITENAMLKQQALTWERKAKMHIANANHIRDTVPYYVKRFSGYYDSVIVVAADTCKPILRHYKRMRDVTDSLLLIQITYFDSAIVSKDSAIFDYKKVIRNDSTILSDSTKVLINYGKKRFWKGFKWGFGTGVILTEGVNLAKDIKK